MFDTIHVRTAAPYPQEIHEHRAPTDASVKLLSELEQAALDKVLSVNRLENNLVHAEWAVIDEPMRMELRVVCRMKINGQEMKFETDVDRPWRTDSHRQVIERIYQKLAHCIVGQLVEAPQVLERILRR
jgi:hypothetical protein